MKAFSIGDFFLLATMAKGFSARSWSMDLPFWRSVEEAGSLSRLFSTQMIMRTSVPRAGSQGVTPSSPAWMTARKTWCPDAFHLPI